MTPIDPPPGLLDKVAEARISVQEKHQYFASHGPGSRSIYACTGCDARFPDRHGHPAHVADLVDRAAWDAVAEGLGLSEDHITTPAETRALRVIAANEAARTIAGPGYPAPVLPPTHHAPGCPMGAGCWCSGRWTRRAGVGCQCHEEAQP